MGSSPLDRPKQGPEMYAESTGTSLSSGASSTSDPSDKGERDAPATILAANEFVRHLGRSGCCLPLHNLAVPIFQHLLRSLDDGLDSHDRRISYASAT